MQQEKKQQVIILSGIPCSGKSTWAEKYVSENKDTVRLNLDSYRFMLNNYSMNKKVEKVIMKMFFSDLRILLESNFDIIIDNTNTKESYINNYVEIINEFENVKIKNILIDVSLDDSFERNKKRSKVTGVFIPEHVISSMYENLNELRLKLTFDEIIKN